MHVLAISGQHVAILGAVIYFALRLLAIPATVRAGVTIGLIWPYILIAGAPPSAIRAGVVASLELTPLWTALLLETTIWLVMVASGSM